MKGVKTTKKNEFVDELLKDFHDPKRWEKVIDDFSRKEHSTDSIQNRDFLIQKYKSKFPQTNNIPLSDEKVIRL
jgi:hypothetical protein